MELLQARLLKSACQQIHGAQFDVVQSGAILESIFKTAVAGVDVPLRFGPSLLTGMLDRQQDQVAGIQAFISSLKVCMLHVTFRQGANSSSTPICVISMLIP